MTGLFSHTWTRHKRCIGAVPVLVLVVLAACCPPVAGAGTDPWSWPLDPPPQVVRGFDPPSDPWGPGHRGVDLAGSVGQPVLAVDAGTVTYAGLVAGRGVVVVSHGAVRSTYQPVLAAVAVGDQVEVGTVLGALSVVDSHCLPAACLHLGAKRGDTYLDPLLLLSDRPIRLKPLDGTSTRSPPATVEPRPPAAPVHLTPGKRARSPSNRLVPSPPRFAEALGARMGLTVGRA